MLSHWQQLAWQDNYRQLLEQDRFDFKQVYCSLQSRAGTAATNTGGARSAASIRAASEACLPP